MSDWLDAEAHADRALEMFERGRWSEAESEFRKAISLNPEQAEWHYNLGLTLEAAGRDAEALACYDRAAVLMPEQPEPMLAAGMVSHRVGKYRDAIGWFDRAIAVAPAHEPAFAGRIDALVRLERHDEAEVTFYLGQQSIPEPGASLYAAIAESLIDRERWDRAGWCLREALRIDPGMPRLRARLATVLAETGHPQRALQMYLRELRDDPGNLDTLLDYGELLMDLGRLPEAAEKFRRVLELEPANPDAHVRLGQIAGREGRWDKALLEFELVLKLDPSYPGIRLMLAEGRLRRGDLAAARAALRDELETIRLESMPGAAWPCTDDAPGEVPAPAPDLDRLSGLLVEADMHEPLRRLLERRGIDRSCDPVLLRRLAWARFLGGDHDGGAAASRRVLRFDPDCLASMHNLALVALEAGQLRLAAGWISRGLRVDRHDPGIRRLRVRLTWAGVRAWVRRRRS